MIRPWVPERVDTPAPGRKRLHVTARALVGLMAMAAGIVSVWMAVDDLAPRLPGAVAGVVLVVVAAGWAFSPPRGVPAMYAHAPEAPREARERGRLATAVVESHTVERYRLNLWRDVTFRLVVAGPDGRRYRTTTAHLARRGAPPAHRRGDVVAVRVHPEQRGVVVPVDEEPTAPPPEPLRRPVPEYSGVPAHTRGMLLRQPAASLLMLAAMVVGIFIPMVAWVALERI